jgi:hypothetical protein
MKGIYKGICIVIIASLFVVALFIASCAWIPPDLVLRVVNPSYTLVGNTVTITFELYNSGSETLNNCKVKWYVDGTSNGDIDYDGITVWVPSTGVDLSVGETDGPFNVDITSVLFGGGVEFYGIYEMGWDSPSSD